ncbi:MAG: MOSC domain-containing protein [Firmicutes bacterium]|nr:MOSC domain-containing protein [Bacillota bacterium]
METYVNTSELEEGVSFIKASPRDVGTIDLIVRRPSIGEREELQQGELDLKSGLIGDNWLARGYRKTADGNAHPDMQLTIMNSRAIALIAKKKSRWQLAGDQLFVDFNLSDENIPPGSLLLVGDAMIEVTAEPHLGCKKFSDRFGRDAVLFVNSEIGRSLNLRGINAKVVEPGKVKIGAKINRLST